MITFAELDENLNVKRVITVSEANNADENGAQDENVGISFCKKLYGEETIWRQALGKRGETHRGQIFNEDIDVFIDPQPYPSWTLVDKFWTPPYEEPTLTEEQIEQGCRYYWDEDVHQANSSEGWILVEPQIVSIIEEPNDVTVSVGSSAIIGAGVTSNRGIVDGASLLKYTMVDSEIDESDWIYASFEIEYDSEANNVSTGILTTTDYSGDYRIEFYGSEGSQSITTSFTLTVNE